MPPASSTSADIDEEDLSYDPLVSGHSPKKVECHFFNESMGNCPQNGRGCNKTVTCKSSGSEPNPACFILWENKRMMWTDPSTGKSVEEFGRTVIKLKGCWNGHSATSCSEASECIERRKSAKKDLFFCCCRGDYCNNEFSHLPVDDDLDIGLLFNF